MSEQYDEQPELSVETTEDAADVEETTDQPETESGLEPGESPAAELEDQYGEANDGPEIEDDPRLDTEVTDETTDLEMGLDDTEDDGATSFEMSAGRGRRGAGGRPSRLRSRPTTRLTSSSPRTSPPSSPTTPRTPSTTSP